MVAFLYKLVISFFNIILDEDIKETMNFSDLQSEKSIYKMEIVLLSVSVMLMRDLIEFAERKTTTEKDRIFCVTLGLLSCYISSTFWPLPLS